MPTESPVDGISQGAETESIIIVADASVLINFLRVEGMALLGEHPSSFLVTDDVAAEILKPQQVRSYSRAIRAGLCNLEHGNLR